MIDGVVFDMDGVLTDTEQAWIRLFDEMVGIYGERLSDEDKAELFGCSDAVENVVLGRVLGVPADEVAPVKQQWCSMHPMDYGALAIQGNLDTARRLHENGLKVAIASSSSRENVERMVRETGMEDAFDALACGDDVKRAKPAPDVFLRAAELLGIAPAHLVAVDDSPVGVDAAVAAGMTAVQYAVNPDWDSKNPLVTAIVRSTEELEAALLARL